MVIQRILRHANVSTTATYYIKTAADDVRKAMTKLENNIPVQRLKTQTHTYGTLRGEDNIPPSTVNGREKMSEIASAL